MSKTAFKIAVTSRSSNAGSTTGNGLVRRPPAPDALVATSRRGATRYGTSMVTKDDVVEALHGVEDPELGMDIVELGLFYDTEIDGPRVKVVHSLTSMGCPAGPMIQESIHDAVSALPGVEQVDVLMATEGNPQATIVGDLAAAPQIPSDAFDCAIVTQTLQFVYDVRAALATLHRILAPGGVLLATMPGITKISPPEDEEYGEWWHFTARSARRLAEEAFGEGNVDARSHGNVLTAAGFLYGLAASDLKPEELAAHDRLYEVIVGVRAVKRR